jgi:hypothetical protein
MREPDYLPANYDFKNEDLALGPRRPKPSEAGQGCPDENIGRPQYTCERRQRQALVEAAGSVSGCCHKVGVQSYPTIALRSRSVPLIWLLVLLSRPSPAVEPADHCHGHSSNATMVSVVSRQFDRVLVEQNHCQGFRTVATSC